MKKIVQAAGIVAAAATLSLTATGVASAASFSVSSSSGGTYAGYGKATGSVTFDSANSFFYKGSVTDYCPADGASAWAFHQVRYTDGTVLALGEDRDTSGCGDGTSGTWNASATLGKRISAYRVVVKECDKKSDGLWHCSTNSLDIKAGAWIDNPYT